MFVNHAAKIVSKALDFIAVQNYMYAFTDASRTHSGGYVVRLTAQDLATESVTENSGCLRGCLNRYFLRLVRLFEISFNWSINNRKTIIDWRNLIIDYLLNMFCPFTHTKLQLSIRVFTSIVHFCLSGSVLR